MGEGRRRRCASAALFATALSACSAAPRAGAPAARAPAVREPGPARAPGVASTRHPARVAQPADALGWVTGFDSACQRLVGARGDGSVVLVGTFRGWERSGSRDITSRGDQDVFIASVSRRGAVDWLVDAGSTGSDEMVVFDVAGGQVVVAFRAAGPVQVGGRAAGGPGTIVVALGRSDGRLRWSRVLHAKIAELAAMADRGALVTFDVKRGTEVERLADGGSTVWRHRLSAGYAWGVQPAADREGHMVVAAKVRGTARWDGQPLGPAPAPGRDRWLVAMLDPATGAPRAVRSLTPEHDRDLMWTRVTLVRGRVVLAGDFNGVLRLGHKPLHAHGWADAFVAALSADLRSTAWVQHFWSFSSDGISSLARGNRLVLAGTTQGVFNLGGARIGHRAQQSWFAAELDPKSGRVTWAAGGPGDSHTAAAALAAPGGHVVVVSGGAHLGVNGVGIGSDEPGPCGQIYAVHLAPARAAP